tara:strand:- start:168 stop:389 length:222 start_codon:yes stop_codon:yes gene_type:complete
MIGGRPLSPVHHSPAHGVHSDIGTRGPDKMHVPFQGQTTLPTFGIGGRPSYQNDARLGGMGGSLVNRDISGGY